MFKFISFLTVFSILSLSTFATEAKQAKKLDDENIIITSQKLEHDNLKRKAIFNKDVKVINGDVTMTADKMTCYFNKKNEIHLIIAEGHVVVIKETKKVTAGRAIYRLEDEVIRLANKPIIYDRQNRIHARKVTVYVKKSFSLLDEPESFFYKEDAIKKTDKK